VRSILLRSTLSPFRPPTTYGQMAISPYVFPTPRNTTLRRSPNFCRGRDKSSSTPSRSIAPQLSSLTCFPEVHCWTIGKLSNSQHAELHATPGHHARRFYFADSRQTPVKARQHSLFTTHHPPSTRHFSAPHPLPPHPCPHHLFC